MKDEIIEEILSHFGRTGSGQRPRIRKFHAELLYTKYKNNERVLNKEEINRPKEYMDRLVKYSKGFLEYINEEALEVRITDDFFKRMDNWEKQYTEVQELNETDENLADQGILINDNSIKFNGKLSYSKFYKVVSDEGESMNDPKNWEFSDEDIEKFEYIDFQRKDTPLFSSKLALLKVYILRKIDEVAFVTSRFVHCPACNRSYVIPAMKTEFQTTYKCEQYVGAKQCGTALKKFPARKMIPTYIYEVAIEVRSKGTFEYKEFFLESFIELSPGYYTCSVFGRTEQKTNSFYFTCLTAREEKSKVAFAIENYNSSHKLFDITQSVTEHFKRVGFIIDEEKAQLPVIIETMKKLVLVVNKEINMDHSLYAGAPGIGKSVALTLLHNTFYSNSGFISGPRFSLAGLTGGQKEIYYQDTAKKKNVPGLFSMQAFIFDEINNDQFLADDKSINLFKSVALSPSGTSSTVGGKEFIRAALVAGTMNYDIGYLRRYENTIKKIYNTEGKSDNAQMQDQAMFLSQAMEKKEIPADFDFYAPIREYGLDVPQTLRNAVLKVREGDTNYLTNFPKPLMERFFWAVLVHPKYDKMYLKQKQIDVQGFLKSRKSIYSQRELFSQLYVPDFDQQINDLIKETREKFEDKAVEEKWSNEARDFLNLMSNKYVEFFSMFHRVNQVPVFILFTLSLINGETELSFSTKRIFEKLISLLHTPIEIKDFHNPDFEAFRYIGEDRGEIMTLIKRFPNTDIRNFVDYDNRALVRKILAELETNHRIKKVSDYIYEIDDTQKYEEISGRMPERPNG